ncbi:MAG TPA: dephospho-CoA kinase [Candidatus Polarisedimenticolaceae bacterium]
MATRPVLRVGLTGGIASGKTTVASLLAERGAFVLDADRIGHDLIAPGGAAHAGVVARFGPAIVEPDGSISRPRLAAIVFADDEARRALDALVHPHILPEVERLLAAYLETGRALVAVVDAALLVEAGMTRAFHRLVVVRCVRETQIRRLMTRNGLTQQEAERRIDVQAPLKTKLAAADYVIDTDGTMRQTREQVDRLWRDLLGDYEALTRTPAPS